MTNLVTTENAQRDGFDSAAANRVDKPIRGPEFKFDGVIYHTGKEKTRPPDDQEYVAVDMAEGWRFLKKDCPVEYRMDLASYQRDQLDRTTNPIGRPVLMASRRIRGASHASSICSIHSPRN
jgi:hypothetical protein